MCQEVVQKICSFYKGGLFPYQSSVKSVFLPAPLRSRLALFKDMQRICGPEQVLRYPPDVDLARTNPVLLKNRQNHDGF
jgi:hypothetical protein